MNGVRDQGKEHLLQLDSISLNFRQLCARLDLHIHLALLQIGAFQDQCVSDQFVDVERGVRSEITSKYRANASDDLSRAMAVGNDPLERLLRFVDTWHRVIEKAKTRLGTGNHRRQRLSDLMSNRRRHSVSGHESRLALTTLSEDCVEQLRVGRLNLVGQDGRKPLRFGGTRRFRSSCGGTRSGQSWRWLLLWSTFPDLPPERTVSVRQCGIDPEDDVIEHAIVPKALEHGRLL